MSTDQYVDLDDPNVIVDEFIFTPGGSVVPLATGKTRGSRRRLLAALVAGVVVAAAAGAYVLTNRVTGADAEPIVFKYGFQKGETRSYGLAMKIDLTPKELPDTDPFSGTMRATLRYVVVNAAEDGSAVVDLIMEGVTMEPRLGAAPFAGGKIRATIRPDGRIVDIEGGAGLFSGGVGNLLPSGTGGPTGSSEAQFFFPQFPSKGLKPGDSWDDTSTQPLPFGKGTLTMKATGTHNGFEESSFGRAAKINYVADVPMDLSFTFAEMAGAIGQAVGGAGAVPPEVANARMTIAGAMKMKADSLVIPKTGEIVDLDGVVDMNMQMSVQGLPASPVGSQIPSSFGFDAKMQMELTRMPG